MLGRVRKTQKKLAKTLEQCLCETVDELLGNHESSEFKRIVPRRVFLNCVFDWIEVSHQPRQVMADCDEKVVLTSLMNPLNSLISITKVTTISFARYGKNQGGQQ